MNTKITFAIFAIMASMTIGTVLAINPVYADKSSGSNGLETADVNVHENTGPVSSQDVRFHEGLCQGGHTTEALDGLGGCDILTSPANSDDNRQD